MCSVIAVAKSDLYFKYVAIPDGEIQIRNKADVRTSCGILAPWMAK
jgi:hypothetical protein